MKAKQVRDNLWRKLRKNPTEVNKNNYKEARNEYTKVRRQEEAKYERTVVEKYEKNPKLFHKYIKSKTKVKDEVIRLREGNKIIEDEEELAEVLVKNLKSVFKVSVNNVRLPRSGEGGTVGKLDSVNVDIAKILEKLKGLDVNKSMGPDGVNKILKLCADELCEPIYILISSSLNMGTVPEQ